MLVEGLREVRLQNAAAATLQVYALDPAGKRRARVATTVEEGELVIALTPDNQTIWYEVSAQKDESVAPVVAAAAGRC